MRYVLQIHLFYKKASSIESPYTLVTCHTFDPRGTTLCVEQFKRNKIWLISVNAPKRVDFFPKRYEKATKSELTRVKALDCARFLFSKKFDRHPCHFSRSDFRRTGSSGFVLVYSSSLTKQIRENHQLSIPVPRNTSMSRSTYVRNGERQVSSVSWPDYWTVVEIVSKLL